ncbi:MAG: PRC-barrel domain-containing protein [Roseiarcus sp.]|jgi:sporulation protein YlmC with PRC-barrel domain|uniref:PRC-barrel domain-containing protein n=1 Tax=Roseiarcus sp. TaxID=1969460 RepID=UPI003BB05D67
MRTLFLAAAATVALASATAMAQNASDTTKANPTMNPPATTADTAKTTAADVPAKGPDFINLQNSDMLSSNVVGLDIYNEQNNDIGKIQDVAFDSSMKITGYILSVGGFLGMGTHYVAVDPGAVSIKYDASNKVWRAAMNATKDQLKSAPEFKYGGQWTASRS